MPDDLLRFLEGPASYSLWYLVGGILLLLGIIGWCAGVVVWTLPGRSLQRLPVIRDVHAQAVRRRYTRMIREAVASHRAGRISTREAAETIRHALRGFLVSQVGSRVHYVHVGDMSGVLAPAAPVFTDLDAAQFDTEPAVDLDGVGRRAEELITSWT